MSKSILHGFGAARESAYFKLENEADVASRRQQLKDTGKLRSDEQIEDSNCSQPVEHFKDSLSSYEVLPEVLQAQTRVDDPIALKRRQYERRIRGEPPPPSLEDLLKVRSALGAGAMVAHLPKVSFGRSRWQHMQSEGSASSLVPSRTQLSPEAVEVARRTYIAGLRSLVYGTAAACVVLTLGGSWILNSIGDDKTLLTSRLQPIADFMKALTAPIKQTAIAWVGNSASSEKSQFQQKLKSRYNPDKNGKVCV